MKSRLSEIKQSAIMKFLSLSGLGGLPVNLMDGSTEEVKHEISKGRAPMQSMRFGAGNLSNGRGAQKRLEENYLFDTRRFVTPLVAGEYFYFANAIGLPASNNGYTATLTMSEVETNMDVASQVPQGKDFVMTQVGVSFNANAITADIALMMDAGALRFSKQGGQFTLKHGPIRLWPGGTGVSGYSSSGAAPVVAGGHNGDADIRAVRKLSVPRVLKAKDTFSYSYLVPRSVTNNTNAAFTLSASTLMCVWLWGAQQDNIPV